MLRKNRPISRRLVEHIHEIRVFGFFLSSCFVQYVNDMGEIVVVLEIVSMK